MIFYRTESYQFPHVEATLTVGKENKGLALRLFGAKRPDVALYFSLANSEPVVIQG